jgi:hypothetical protein
MTNECINTITQIIERHAPTKQASRNRMKQLSKPWLSKKLYRSHFLSRDPLRVSIYKSYSNVLNKLKTKTKNEYYNQQFHQCKNNLKSTWKLIGTLINRKNKGQLELLEMKNHILISSTLLSNLISIL